MSTFQPVQQPSVSHMIFRPVLTGIIAAGIDRVILKNINLKSNLAYATSVGVGVMTASKISTMVPPLSLGTLSNGHSVSGRLSEVILGTGFSYATNAYVMGNARQSSTNAYDGLPSFSKNVITQVMVITASDLLATLINEYINGSPLDIYA